jgi:SAM-dependent MidA family methyltransferase
MSQGQFFSNSVSKLAAMRLERNLEQRQAIITGVGRLTDPRVMGDLFKVLAITSETVPPPPPFLKAI